MADNDDKWRREHTNATQNYVFELVEAAGEVHIAARLKGDAELAKAIAHETDRRDEEDGGLTQRIDELTKRVAALEAKPTKIVHHTYGGPCE